MDIRGKHRSGFFLFILLFWEETENVMTQSSTTAVDLDDVSDVATAVPRATDLLRKIKKPERRVRWNLVIAGLGYTAIACMTLVFQFSGKGGENVIGWELWFGLAVLLYFTIEWQHAQDRQELMVQLLDELVAQNNHFRRELEKLAQSKA